MPSAAAAALQAFELKYKCPRVRKQPPPIEGSQHKGEMLEQMKVVLQEPYLALTLRVMRRHHQFIVGNLVRNSGVEPNQLYAPHYLDLWTIPLRLRVRRLVRLGLVFQAIVHRLGLHSVIGLKFCLDGFYGVADYGDVFGNFGAELAPWMEISYDATAVGLKLQDGDSIFISGSNEQTKSLVEQVRSANQEITQEEILASRKQSMVALQHKPSSRRVSASRRKSSRANST